jgi:hypothetical protein
MYGDIRLSREDSAEVGEMDHFKKETEIDLILDGSFPHYHGLCHSLWQLRDFGWPTPRGRRSEQDLGVIASQIIDCLQKTPV